MAQIGGGFESMTKHIKTISEPCYRGRFSHFQNVSIWEKTNGLTILKDPIDLRGKRLESTY